MAKANSASGAILFALACMIHFLLFLSEIYISGAFVIGIVLIIRAIYFAAIKTSKRIGPA